MDPGQRPQAEANGSFEQVLATYLDDPLTGSAGCRIATIASHAQFATELKDFFDAEDSVSQIANAIPSSHASHAGDRLGNYELLRELGRGGMGVVYLARDKRLDREVALKLIGAQGSRSPNEIWRFQNEVDAISQLSHPSLVPIFDYGEHHGQFYFTMKHIDGQSLAVWTATHHARMQSSATKRDYELTVAKIVRDIARAIHHAHQRGILHRDLKPTNILLEQDDHPVVVDFGLAKQMQEDLAMTQTGALVGTPAYMAPELLLKSDFHGHRKTSTNPMTTAVDVYGLGTILYFLLMGRAPFESQNLFELLSQVREQQARSLCSSNSLVDRGLDAICGKCLEKTPSDRYESAEALASDLECWLNGRPLVARPLPFQEKVIRWCYRHKVLVGLMILVSASILFGIGALTMGLQVATEARDSAIKQRQEALKNLRVVIQEINDLENRRPDLDEMRLDLLTRIQDQLRPMLNDNVHGSLADETSFWLEVDAGDTQENRGHFDAAREHFAKAMAIAQKIPDDEKGNQQRIYSFALSHMGDLETTKNHGRQAVEYFQQCLRVRETLAEKFPSIQANADLALAKLKLAISLLSLFSEFGGQETLSRELSLARESLAMFQDLSELQPDNVWHARFMGASREMIARGLLSHGEREASNHECRQGVAELEAAAKRLPEYRLILEWHACYIIDLLANCCWCSGRFDEGEQAGRRTLEIRRRIVEFNPQATQTKHLQLQSLDRIGQNQMGMEKWQEAIQTLREAVNLFKEFRSDGAGIDFLRSEVHCVEHFIMAAEGYEEFDVETVQAMDLCFEVLQHGMDSSELGRQQAGRIFDMIIAKLQLLLLCERREEAHEVFRELQRFASETPTLQNLEPVSEQLNFQLELLAADASVLDKALLKVPLNPGLMFRLQNRFEMRRDAEGLADVSDILFHRVPDCMSKRLGAKGMAKARALDPTGVGIRYQPQFEKMLEALRNYVGVADPWIKELIGE